MTNYQKAAAVVLAVNALPIATLFVTGSIGAAFSVGMVTTLATFIWGVRHG